MKQLKIRLGSGAPDVEDLAVAGDFQDSDSESGHEVSRRQRANKTVPRHANDGHGHQKNEETDENVPISGPVQKSAANQGADQITDRAGRHEAEEVVDGRVGEGGQVDHRRARHAVVEALEDQRLFWVRSG